MSWKIEIKTEKDGLEHNGTCCESFCDEHFGEDTLCPICPVYECQYRFREISQKSFELMNLLKIETEFIE